VIKTFRPLLRLLKVQNIPNPPDLKVIFLADMRNLIIKGMGRCVVIIEQRSLTNGVGGMLITSYDTRLDCFLLHIVINSSFCGKTSLEDRARQKIIAVHEFTHTVAALSAISRVRSNDLIKRLKDIFRKKAHALYLTDLEHLVSELTRSPAERKNTDPQSADNARYFPDEHFRLGFEDFPVSYPIVFDEFLFSREMFDEYFPKEVIDSVYEAFRRKDSAKVIDLIAPYITKISQDKALYEEFVVDRVLDILFDKYAKLMSSKK
jgi:hypothetical protein